MVLGVPMKIESDDVYFENLTMNFAPAKFPFATTVPKKVRVQLGLTMELSIEEATLLRTFGANAFRVKMALENVVQKSESDLECQDCGGTGWAEGGTGSSHIGEEAVGLCPSGCQVGK